MANIFSTEASVFFVGGTGTKAGNAYCGGCTRDWYDNNFTELSDIMGDNGAPLTVVINGTFTNATKRVFKTYGFPSVQVGMVAYVSGTNIVTGRYKITDVISLSEIELSGITAFGDNVDTMVNVGGAFDDLQNALDDTSASYYDCDIYINKDTTLTTSIDADTGGGSVVRNTHKRIIGFHTIPGDMSYGGQYYQGAIDTLQNGVDTNKCVLLNGNGGGYDVVKITVSNISLENLYIYNTDKSNNHNAISFTGTPQYITLQNCKSDTVYQVVADFITGLVLIDCFNGTDLGNPPWSAGTDTVILSSVLQSTGSVWSVVNHDSGGVLLLNSILIGGGKGLNNAAEDSASTVVNCVFYDQVLSCLWLRNSSCTISLNNILMPQSGANGIYVTSGGASVLYNDYDCYIDTNGNILADPVETGYTNGTPPALGVHSLEVDPQFVDAAGVDFRPRNTKVLRGGMPVLGSDTEHIGATLQKNELAIRSRVVNLGRLGIIR
jgi:hypothetical protein